MTEWMLGVDPRLVPFLQLGSTAILAVASLFVASVAAIIGYRNSNGWRPLLVAPALALIPMKRPDGVSFWMSFEVWNRRKYPVVVRQLFVKVREVELTEVLLASIEPDERSDDEDHDEAAEWMITWGKKVAQRRTEFIVEPGKHVRFGLRCKFETSGGYESFMNMKANIRAQVYDPKKNRNMLLKASSPSDGSSERIDFDK